MASIKDAEEFINVQVPRELHRKMKVEAAKAEVSLKVAVAMWLEKGMKGAKGSK